MSRYIDADAIITFVSAGHLRNPMEKAWSDNAVVDMIESRPTVDAVPVTRCEDCKWCEYPAHNSTKYGCRLFDRCVKGDWFCADGERR